MIPLKLRLKKFKGIRSAWGADEVTIDLSRLPGGLVAITGPIGSGKTTLLDNLHPYRIMPYRAGEYSEGSFSFYAETYGRDACKELEFIVGEHTFRSLVHIDAERRTQQAYLYRAEGDEWVVHGNTHDGRLDDYDRAVHELLGTPRGFFTYVFRRQRARELSGYTKGEMKEIFSELLDVEDLKKKAERARKHKDELVETLKQLRQERRRLEEEGTAAVRKRALRFEIEEKLAGIARSLSAAEEEYAAIQEKIRDAEVKILLQHDHEKNRGRLEKNLAEEDERAGELAGQLQGKRQFYHAKHRALAEQLKTARRLAATAPSLRDAAEKEASTLTAIEALKAEREDFDARYLACTAQMTERARTEARMNELARKLDGRRLKRTHAREVVLQQIAHAEKSAEQLKAAPCRNAEPDPGRIASPEGRLVLVCPLAKTAAEESRRLPSLHSRLKELEEKDAGESALEEQLRALEERIARKEEIEAEARRCRSGREETKAALATLEDTLKFLRERAKDLPEAAAAERALPLLEQDREELIEEGNRTLRDLHREIALVEREQESLKKALASLGGAQGLDETLKEAQHRSAAAAKALADLRREQMQLFEKKGKVKEELRKAAAAAERLAAIDAEIETVSSESAEWAFLEKALGNDGLIALEIDDAGPSVAGITNDLIHTCFGGRFSVRIDTQGERAKGAGTKEIFDIVVFDAERNEQKSLKSMSGGEKILIESAVKNALCIFNARRSGIPYGTLFTDEEDGGLDAEKKKDFIRIKRRVLELGGYEREFFISHTPEVVALADDVLSMEEIAGGCREEALAEEER